MALPRENLEIGNGYDAVPEFQTQIRRSAHLSVSRCADTAAVIQTLTTVRVFWPLTGLCADR